MMLENRKNYYAVIPASVRYDQNLCANSKLLYGEITALCNEKGYCWASNQYFAELYNVSKTTVSRWISLLEENHYIVVRLNYKEGSSEIESRYIYIINPMNYIQSTPTTPNNEEKAVSKQVKSEAYASEIKEIIDYLNLKTNSNYRYNTESTNKLIRSKLNNGFVVDDFKAVIDKKSSEWVNTEFEKYLRPSTLFGNKFEQYVNQKVRVTGFTAMNPIYQTQMSNTNVEKPTDFLYDNKGNLVRY